MTDIHPDNMLICTHTEQYGRFLWLTKFLVVSVVLQTSQWKHPLCQFYMEEMHFINLEKHSKYHIYNSKPWETNSAANL